MRGPASKCKAESNLERYSTQTSDFNVDQTHIHTHHTHFKKLVKTYRKKQTNKKNTCTSLVGTVASTAIVETVRSILKILDVELLQYPEIPLLVI